MVNPLNVGMTSILPTLMMMVADGIIVDHKIDKSVDRQQAPVKPNLQQRIKLLMNWHMMLCFVSLQNCRQIYPAAKVL